MPTPWPSFGCTSGQSIIFKKRRHDKYEQFNLTPLKPIDRVLLCNGKKKHNLDEGPEPMEHKSSERPRI